MDKILDIATVDDYNRYWGLPTRHPLVNVLEGERLSQRIPHCLKHFGLYVIFLKDLPCADHLKYGRNEYDCQANTLVFISPGQVLGNPADGSTFAAKGWCLFFSPEMLHGTSLGRHIKDYTFFSYDVHEALHISEQERQTVVECMRRIDDEIAHGADSHSRPIIASAIELLLNYCRRFYDRQFATRHPVNVDVLTQFEHILDGYFLSDAPRRHGTPTVAYCAQQLHLSPNYFGDLIRKETGRSAQDHIMQRITHTAMDMLARPGLGINEIAYALGYQYPQYFTRAFKRSAGCTPSEYRQQLLG